MEYLGCKAVFIFFSPLVEGLQMGREAQVEPRLRKPNSGVPISLKLCSPTYSGEPKHIDDSFSCPCIFEMVSLSSKISRGKPMCSFLSVLNIIIRKNILWSYLELLLAVPIVLPLFHDLLGVAGSNSGVQFKLLVSIHFFSRPCY